MSPTLKILNMQLSYWLKQRWETFLVLKRCKKFSAIENTLHTACKANWMTGLVHGELKLNVSRCSLNFLSNRISSFSSAFASYFSTDVRLPQSMQRSMAAEAEASREARAKVIAAEGEQKASRQLKEAADVIAESPIALQLRYLQTLTQISAEKNSTIVFPVPGEWLIDVFLLFNCWPMINHFLFLFSRIIEIIQRSMNMFFSTRHDLNLFWNQLISLCALFEINWNDERALWMLSRRKVHWQSWTGSILSCITVCDNLARWSIFEFFEQIMLLQQMWDEFNRKYWTTPLHDSRLVSSVFSFSRMATVALRQEANFSGKSYSVDMENVTLLGVANQKKRLSFFSSAQWTWSDVMFDKQMKGVISCYRNGVLLNLSSDSSGKFSVLR